MSKMTQVDFVPKEMVSYCKETQTPTESITHEQKAGKNRRKLTFLPHKLWLNSFNWTKSLLDEEEDEEITAPQPVSDTQEEMDDKGEQQEEGKCDKHHN